MALARFGQICLDCDDPAALAAFWAALLGGEVAPVDDDVVVVGNAVIALAALRVPGYQPPTWPIGEAQKQLHLDLAVAPGGLDAAEAEAIRLRVPAGPMNSRGRGDGGSCLTRLATRSACATRASRYRLNHGAALHSVARVS